MTPVAAEYVQGRLREIAERSRAEPRDNYPDPALCARAWTVIDGLMPEDCPTPSVVPDPEGGVCFVWHAGGWDIEIVAEPDGDDWFYAVDTATGRVADCGSIAEAKTLLVDALVSMCARRAMQVDRR